MSLKCRTFAVGKQEGVPGMHGVLLNTANVNEMLKVLIYLHIWNIMLIFATSNK